jgi:hypothetical protein
MFRKPNKEWGLYMIKITKLGEINRNKELICDLCKTSIPLGTSFFSVIIPIPDNPSQNHVACNKCAEECR